MIQPISQTTFDLETRLAEDHHQAIKLWLRLLTCTHLMTGEIRSRLSQDFNTTLPRFDLLAQLERHPTGLKMGELSRRMMVTTGNITGITDQLESEGLVRREVDPLDRRSFRVCLTAKGKSVFEQMARVHEGWVIELFSGLSPSDKESLFGILSRLKQHLNREEQL